MAANLAGNPHVLCPSLSRCAIHLSGFLFLGSLLPGPHSPNVVFAEVLSWPPKFFPTSTPISNTGLKKGSSLTPHPAHNFSQIPCSQGFHSASRQAWVYLWTTLPSSGLLPLALYSVASPDGSCFPVSPIVPSLFIPSWSLEGPSSSSSWLLAFPSVNPTHYTMGLN